MEDEMYLQKELLEESLIGKYLTYFIGEETYGIEIRYVIEIVGIKAITEMPEMPVYIKGIINLRGKIIPVIDARLRFGKQERQYDDRTCIIVMSYNEILIGLIVDNVSDVLTIPQEGVVELPNINTFSTNGFIKYIGKIEGKIILVLNCARLITDEDLSQLVIHNVERSVD